MDKTQILLKLKNLKRAFDAGQIPTLKEHEVNPGLPLGSRENYLYFMLTCCINFQRSSPKTWASALATWQDPQTQFIFFPEKVVKVSETDLRTALLKHKLALQPNKHIQIWQRICRTLNQYFQNDPRQILSQGNHNAAAIIQILQKEMKKDFPYLSGPKLSNYSLFILLRYTDLKLSNTGKISIIPDTHIMQATGVLGILEPKDLSPLKVEAAWNDLLNGSEYSPIDFHSILWNWSRNNFQPQA